MDAVIAHADSVANEVLAVMSGEHPVSLKASLIRMIIRDGFREACHQPELHDRSATEE